MATWWHEVRIGLRTLWRTPRVSVVVVVCIGLAIGLNATIFSIAGTLLFRNLPVERPDRLVRVFQSYPDFPYASFSHLNYRDVRDRNQVFSGFTTGALRPVDLRTDSGTERRAAEIVAANYFEVLGVAAQVGRGLLPADDTAPGASAVVVLSDRLWRSRFGARPDVVGQTLTLNGHPFTVAGVAPRGFSGGTLVVDVDLWVPLMMEPVVQPAERALDERGSGWLFLTTGRLRDGVSMDDARAELGRLERELTAELGWEDEDLAFTVMPLRDTVVAGPQMQGPLAGGSAMLLVMVGLVLLVACANVANLLLARAAARRREMSIRVAAGARGGQLVRQLLTESLLLAGFGGVLGVVLGWWSARLLPGLVPAVGVPVRLELLFDARVVAFTLAVTVATGLLFGILPALAVRRANVVAGLRGLAGPRRRRGWAPSLPSLQKVLVVAQVALCSLLLVIAFLFVRSLRHARTLDPGFRTGGVLLAALDPSLQGYQEAQVREFYRRLDEGLAAQPGVAAVTFAEVVPLSLTNSQQRGIEVEGYQPAPGERMNPDYNIVDWDYLETLQIPLVAGRGFERTDDAARAPVILISRTTADRYWPGREAVGGRISTSGEWRTVIGVFADHAWKGLGRTPEPYFLLPMAQVYEPALEVIVVAHGDPGALALPLRREVERLLPSLALSNVRSFDTHAAVALFPARVGAGFLAGFGVLALVLAAVGLYGVLDYTVAQRTREIAIRMALGEERSRVLRHTLRGGLVLVGVGLGIGLVGAAAVGRLVRGMLFGTQPVDPASFLVVALVLGVVAVAACWLPARRAMSVDPWQVMRSD